MLICLSGRFLSKVIFSSTLKVLSRFGICISWYSHELMSRRMVTIRDNRILGIGCWLTWLTYLAGFGYLVIVLI